MSAPRPGRIGDPRRPPCRLGDRATNVVRVRRLLVHRGGDGGLDVVDFADDGADPFPASPAHAASMVALSASRLVCSAMALMTWTTLRHAGHCPAAWLPAIGSRPATVPRRPAR
jgi:hypothetical protein